MTDATGDEYEAHVARRRAEKNALLQKLALGVGPAVPRARAAKSRRKSANSTPAVPTRRSARLSSGVKKALVQPADNGYQSGVESSSGDESSEKVINRSGKRKRTYGKGHGSHNPTGKIYPKIEGEDPARIFGPIPDVEVGTWWATRIDCGRARVHAPPVSGIFGTTAVGCYSIAISAGYPEDVDDGETFVYTGSGGRDLATKNLRTGPQTFDQKLEGPNAALAKSVETGLPVRVIRGFKSKLGPETGYRYDGLYRATGVRKEVGNTGKWKVFKFDFERLPDQDPIDYTAGGPVSVMRASSSDSSDRNPEDADGGKEGSVSVSDAMAIDEA